VIAPEAFGFALLKKPFSPRTKPMAWCFVRGEVLHAVSSTKRAGVFAMVEVRLPEVR